MQRSSARPPKALAAEGPAYLNPSCAPPSAPLQPAAPYPRDWIPAPSAPHLSTAPTCGPLRCVSRRLAASCRKPRKAGAQQHEAGSSAGHGQTEQPGCAVCAMVTGSCLAHRSLPKPANTRPPAAPPPLPPARRAVVRQHRHARSAGAAHLRCAGALLPAALARTCRPALGGPPACQKAQPPGSGPPRAAFAFFEWADLSSLARCSTSTLCWAASSGLGGDPA